MAHHLMKHLIVPLLLIVSLSVIVSQASNSPCKGKLNLCKNMEAACEESCPGQTCTVECNSCQPICTSGSGRSLLESEGGGDDGDDDKEGKEGGEKKKGGDDDDDDKEGKEGGEKKKGGDDDDDDKEGKGKKDDDKEDKDDKKGKGEKDGDDKGDDDDEGGKGGKGGKGDDDEEEGKGQQGQSPPPRYPTPYPPQQSPPPPPTPVPSTPTPTPSPPPASPPTPTPSPPTESPPVTPPTATPPTSSPPQSPPPPTVTPPSPPTPTPSPPTETPPVKPPTATPPTSSPPVSPPKGNVPKKSRCMNESYKACYYREFVCPSNCPYDCVVDCKTCRPVCSCDKPGAVCQDPRFIGGDGITFYFHGKKDRDFCLVSDENLHINAHFIGKRSPKMTRDFTWVQSIAILFDSHRITVGALKTSTWDDSVDRIFVTFDGVPLLLPERQGVSWESRTTSPRTFVTRSADTNSVVVEVEGTLRIAANVVPITQEDSRIHNYGVTADDCMAHLDLGFKFYSLSGEVNGVLGQTYRAGYVSPVSVSAKMAVMGREKEFETSSLFAPDCAAARFVGSGGGAAAAEGIYLPSLRCESGMDGHGVVCKR